jgi:hypothetical protein
VNAKNDDFDAEDSYYSVWYGESDPPYGADTIDGTAKESLSVYRFWDSSRDNHEAGPWTTDAADIDQLRSDSDITSDEIVNRYAIPGTVDRVTKFDVQGDTQVRISEAAPNYDGDGGGTQYEIRGENMKKETDDINTKNMPVDVEERMTVDELLDTE